MKTVKAWWFSEGYELPYGDGRKIVMGGKHQIRGQIAPCIRGLHASKNILDALKYAPGPIVWRVELSGEIVREDDKLCASERTYISGGIDASEVLRKFARLCALDVVHLWDCPEVVLQYLKTGDENLQRAAWSAAWSAAGSAAWSAAWSAAGSAAWSAARSAAWSAAWSAARSAAWSAAGSAAKKGQNKRLTTMINAFYKKQGKSGKND